MNSPAGLRSPRPQSTLQQLVLTHRMNDPVGDIAHHFALSGKVKTIYVNQRQHRGLVSGALAIVVLDGRHHLIPSSVVRQIVAREAGVPVIVARQSEVHDDVPDDLIW